ncbi:MAG: NADH-quinone oxidoreductase subunit H [Bdellovibrionales bacterium]|nr:NADH-quinone oxidoreductase subunit H [Bdellovibrionales bacterium]
MMFHAMALALEGVAVAAFLTASAVVLLQLERRVQALVEHRVGPDQVGPGGALQLLADLFKMVWRGRRNLSLAELPFWTALFFLPFVFTAILFFEAPRTPVQGREVLALLLLILVSGILEAFISIWRTGGTERYAFARHIPSRAMGILTMSICVAVVFLHTGATSLEWINGIQKNAPFLLLLRGPGTLLSSVIFFLSVLVVEAQRPFASGEDKSVGGVKNFFFQFLSRLWVVALFSFWAVVFCGGLDGPTAWLLLLPRVAFVSVVYIWMSRVFPGIRSGDAQEIQMKIFLPASLLAFVMEACWLFFLRGHS